MAGFKMACDLMVMGSIGVFISTAALIGTVLAVMAGGQVEVVMTITADWLSAAVYVLFLIVTVSIVVVYRRAVIADYGDAIGVARWQRK